MSELGRAALAYAKMGYRVFPCVPGEKRPLTSHGCKDATDEVEQIERWWIESPNANIGLSTENLYVVDIDGADNPWPGQEHLEELEDIPCSKTPRGGSHLIFRGPGKNTASIIAPKVDTRGQGGYIVVAPSVVAGRMYSWRRMIRAPEQLESPPEWARVKEESRSLGLSVPVNGNTLKIPQGGRNQTLASLGGKLRAQGFSPGEIDAALRQINLERCTPPLEEKEVSAIAASISRYEPKNGIDVVESPTWETIIRTPIVSSKSLVDLIDCPVDYVLSPLFPKGCLVLLQGNPKSGKSVFALYCSMCSSLGAWGDTSFSVPKPANVLLMEYEDSASLVAKRLNKYISGLGLTREDFPQNLFFSDYPEFWLDSAKHVDALIAEIATRKLDLVVIDTLSHVHRAENENAASDIKPAMAALKRIAKKSGACIVAIHHSAKGSSERNIAERGRGSSVIAAAADVIIDWGNRKGTNVTPVEMVSKIADSKDFSIEYRPNDDGSVEWQVIDVAGKESYGKQKSMVLETIKRVNLKNPTGFSYAELFEAMPDMSQKTVYNKVSVLEKEGYLSITSPIGRKGQPALIKLLQKWV